MSKTKLLILDFDGVLADSLSAFYPLIRDAMQHIGLSLTREQYRDFFIGNVHKSFKDFINDDNKYSAFSEFRISNYDKYYFDDNGGVKLFPDSPGFIREISKKYILAIASSGKKDNILRLLSRVGVDNLFALVLANTAYSKEDVLKEILDKLPAKPAESFMVSDTVGDISAVKKVGCKTIAVTWGFHARKLLESAKPDFIADTFQELDKILS